MQRLAGYCLTGSTREQVVPCWYGQGANGKSTLVGIMNYVLGKDYVANLAFSAVEAQNRNATDMVPLAGARFATALETREGVRLNEAHIKAMSGGDVLTARRLYHEQFSIEQTHKLILVFNHRPVISDDSHGMWRRIHLIPLNRKFEGGPVRPEPTGEAEGRSGRHSGVDGAQVSGVAAGRAGNASSRQGCNGQIPEESDHVGKFIEECCVLAETQTITRAALWDCYKKWTEQNEGSPLPQKVFTQKLEGKGLMRDPSGRSRTPIWVGIGSQPTELSL